MNTKLIAAVLLVLIAGMGFLFYQNMQLKTKVEELTTKEAVSITPVNKDSVAAVNTSPFDKPNNDPTLQLPPETPSADKLAVISFDKTKHNFGRIKDGEKVTTTFKFKNTGKVPLIIRDAVGSCGCTVPAWPTEPIPVGESGSITVTFDSQGKSGQTEKTVTVTANTLPSNTVLIVQSTVIPKDK